MESQRHLLGLGADLVRERCGAPESVSRQGDPEAILPDAGQNVLAPHLCPEQVRDGPDRRIPRRLTEGLVHPPEPIEVDVNEREGRPISPGPGELPLEAVPKVVPVRQSRHEVQDGEACDLSPQSTDLGGETDSSLEVDSLRRMRDTLGERSAARDTHGVQPREVAENVDLWNVLEEPTREKAIEKADRARVVGGEVRDHEIDGFVVAILHEATLSPREDDGAFAGLDDPALEMGGALPVVRDQKNVASGRLRR